MPFYPPKKRAGDLPSSATVAGAGSGLGVLVAVLAPGRVVGRGSVGWCSFCGTWIGGSYRLAASALHWLSNASWDGKAGFSAANVPPCLLAAATWLLRWLCHLSALPNLHQNIPIIPNPRPAGQGPATQQGDERRPTAKRAGVRAFHLRGRALTRAAVAGQGPCHISRGFCLSRY